MSDGQEALHDVHLFSSRRGVVGTKKLKRESGENGRAKSTDGSLEVGELNCLYAIDPKRPASPHPGEHQT